MEQTLKSPGPKIQPPARECAVEPTGVQIILGLIETIKTEPNKQGVIVTPEFSMDSLHNINISLVSKQLIQRLDIWTANI